MSRRPDRLEMSDIERLRNTTGRPVLVNGVPMVAEPVGRPGPRRKPEREADDAHDMLAVQLAEAGLPPFEREVEILGPESVHVACQGTGRVMRVTGEAKCGACCGTGKRRPAWRVDYCWRAERRVVEVDGSVHAIRAMQERDVAKRRWLALTGWTVFPVLAREVRDGSAVEWIARWFNDPSRGDASVHVPSINPETR